MTTDESHYTISGVDVSDIRNRNEVRIVEKVKEALEQMGGPELSPQTLRDIYAFVLNLLPARYKQRGSIILCEPFRESHLREAVSRAIK
jgi:hypothetical protein